MTDPKAAGTAGSHSASEHVADLHDGGPVAHEPHGAGDHGTDTEHDDHAHMEVPLGPIDWVAWGVGAVGVGIGLGIAAAFAVSTGLLGV